MIVFKCWIPDNHAGGAISGMTKVGGFEVTDYRLPITDLLLYHIL